MGVCGRSCAGMARMAGVGPKVVTQHGTCSGTGRTDVAKRGRSWIGIDRRGRRSSKEVRGPGLREAGRYRADRELSGLGV
ncbi:hypothetical protein EJB05_29325 [Eragrostis curvula]|uniref:Uncharacterized protein n=1 Tax=Eragrostis curvula TaxID=38414 RepID=A0A5J9UT98_9POAL|nr:hypothetical protein EJB05_29325 [Eragrostis curvula]